MRVGCGIHAVKPDFCVFVEGSRWVRGVCWMGCLCGRVSGCWVRFGLWCDVDVCWHGFEDLGGVLGWFVCAFAW